MRLLIKLSAIIAVAALLQVQLFSRCYENWPLPSNIDILGYLRALPPIYAEAPSAEPTVDHGPKGLRSSRPAKRRTSETTR